MTITKIEVQKNNENRCSVYVDGSFAFGIPIEYVHTLKLQEGKDITEDEWRRIEDQIEYSNGKEKALRYLQYQCRTRKEIEDKLTKDQYSPYVIHKVLDFLNHYGYVDDQEYTEKYIKDRLRFKPMGKRRIQYELQKKGIDQEILEDTFESIDLQEVDHAHTLLCKKIKNPTDFTHKEKDRAVQFLMRRGYSYEIIRKAFDQMQKSEKE